MLRKSAFYSADPTSTEYDDPSFQHEENLEESDQLKAKKKK